MVNYLVIQKEDKFHFSFSKKTTLVPIILFKKDSRSKKFDLLPYLMQIVIDALVPVYQFFKDILINGIWQEEITEIKIFVWYGDAR